MGYSRYPSGSSGITTYATASLLPASATDGSAAITLDTDTLYVYNLASTTWIPIGSPTSVLSIGTFDSGSASSNGLHISGNNLIAQSASATMPGMVNTTTQTFAGAKTFTGNVTLGSAYPTVSGTSVIGSSTEYFGAGFISVIGDSNNDTAIDVFNRKLYDATGTISANFGSRYLTDGFYTTIDWAGRSLQSGGTTALTWTSVHVALPLVTASSALVTDASSNVIASSTTATELGYVHGVTSSIQTQLNGKQPTGNYVTTVGTIDSQTPASNGLVISGVDIYAQSASASNPGLVNTAAQTFAGVKTFNNNVLPGSNLTLNLGGSGSEWSTVYAGTITHSNSSTPNLSLSVTGNNGSIQLTANGTGTVDAIGAKFRLSQDGTNFLEHQYFDSFTLAANTSTPTQVSSSLSFAAASYTGALVEFKVQEASTNYVKVGTLVVACDGTNVSATEYSTETGPIGGAGDPFLFTAALVSGSVQIQFNNTGPSNAVTMRCKITRYRA